MRVNATGPSLSAFANLKPDAPATKVRRMKSIVAGAGLVSVVLWALAGSSVEALERADVSPDENPAVLALLETADQDLDAGRPDDAALVLERALRIEPRNPTVWHYLGLTRFDQGNYSQAEAMAAKSHTLASGNRSLRTRNAGLMASAQRAAGKPVSVPSDEPPVSAWDRLLAEEVEPAVTYAETQLERARSATRSQGWRRLDDPFSERVRRERAARRGQVDSRSVIVFDGHRYRRYQY